MSVSASFLSGPGPGGPRGPRGRGCPGGTAPGGRRGTKGARRDTGKRAGEDRFVPRVVHREGFARCASATGYLCGSLILGELVRLVRLVQIPVGDWLVAGQRIGIVRGDLGLEVGAVEHGSDDALHLVNIDRVDRGTIDRLKPEDW